MPRRFFEFDCSRPSCIIVIIKFELQRHFLAKMKVLHLNLLVLKLQGLYTDETCNRLQTVRFVFFTLSLLICASVLLCVFSQLQRMRNYEFYKFNFQSLKQSIIISLVYSTFCFLVGLNWTLLLCYHATYAIESYDIVHHVCSMQVKLAFLSIFLANIQYC